MQFVSCSGGPFHRSWAFRLWHLTLAGWRVKLEAEELRALHVGPSGGVDNPSTGPHSPACTPLGPQNSGPGTEQGRGGVRVLPLRAPATRRRLCGSQALAVRDRLLPFPAHPEQSCCQHWPRYAGAARRQGPQGFEMFSVQAQQGIKVGSILASPAFHPRQQALLLCSF